MKITALETLRLGAFPNLAYVHVETDAGVTGLGETFYGSQAVEAYVHESLGPKVLGEDATALEALAAKVRPYVGRGGSGAELRSNSAFDMALWDALGKLTGLPAYQLLGGRTHDDLRIYNTCAGTHYVRELAEQTVRNWGLGAQDDGAGYEDLDAFFERPVELAHSLLEQGVNGMKVWPLDPVAERTRGLRAPVVEVREALEPVRRIRDAVGDVMEIYIELHGLWAPIAAEEVLAALEDVAPTWVEDPVPPELLGGFAGRTSVPIAAGEVVAGLRTYAELLSQRALDVLILDVGWCGGLTEARKVFGLAESYGVPVAPHDCTGPVALAASTHLATSQPNAIVQETVRAFYYGWYRDLVTQLPPIEAGRIVPPSGPGLGTELRPELWTRPDAVVRRSEL